MPWRIPEADLDQVKRQTDLLALVRSRGIELAKHGTKDFIGRCPFHDDRNKPNFIVSPAKGLWHCMACGKAGNVIQFVQQHDGVSFRHAFDLLQHGSPAVFSAQPMQKQSTVPKLPCPLDAEADDATLFSQVVSYYHERLKQTPTARAYLASRGLDDDQLIDHFRIGFADRSLGLRLPEKNRMEGERLRSRLATSAKLNLRPAFASARLMASKVMLVTVGKVISLAPNFFNSASMFDFRNKFVLTLAGLWTMT